MQLNSRLIELDLARFLAALAVVLYHYLGRTSFSGSEFIYDVTKFGFLGVPFFFIISGFVISLSAEKSSPIKFFISRFVRLFPTLWVCSTLTYLMLVVTEYPYKDINGFIYVANLFMVNQPLNMQYVDNVYWTLFEELKFYALVGVLLLFKVYTKFKWWLSIWLFLSILYVFTEQPFFWGKITSVKYSAFFVAGVCLYLIYKNREVKIATILLCISFLISGYHMAGHTTNYIPSATVSEKSVVVFINLVIYVYFYSFVTRKKTFISHRTWIVLGGLTYPLYLIHNLFGKSLILKTTPMLGEQLSIAIAFFVSMALAYVISQKLEPKYIPFIKTKLTFSANKLGLTVK